MSLVLLLQFFLPHSRGSSHGQSRIIRRAYPEDFYTQMMAECYQIWAQLEHEAGTRLYRLGWWGRIPWIDPSLYRIFLSLSNSTIPCFTIYHILLQTSRYLHGTLPLLQVCSNASSSMSPTLTTIEKGSPSPSILYLPHSALFYPHCTCHPLMYNTIYLYVLLTCPLLTEL